MQHQTSLCVFGRCENRPWISADVIHCALDRSPHCNRFEMRLQSGLYVRKKLANIRLTSHANQSNHFTIEQHGIRAHSVAIRLAVILSDISCACGLYRDLRSVFRFSTDSYSATAAIIVAGFGLSDCRHILESGSHPPPNGKSSS